MESVVGCAGKAHRCAEGESGKWPKYIWKVTDRLYDWERIGKNKMDRYSQEARIWQIIDPELYGADYKFAPAGVQICNSWVVRQTKWENIVMMRLDEFNFKKSLTLFS